MVVVKGFTYLGERSLCYGVKYELLSFYTLYCVLKNTFLRIFEWPFDLPFNSVMNEHRTQRNEVKYSRYSAICRRYSRALSLHSRTLGNQLRWNLSLSFANHSQKSLLVAHTWKRMFFYVGVSGSLINFGGGAKNLPHVFLFPSVIISCTFSSFYILK